MPLVNDGTITLNGPQLSVASLTNDGTLTIGEADVTDGGNYTAGSSSVLSLELGGTTVGTNEGQLNVSDAMSIGGTLDVFNATAFTPTVSEQFTLATYASKTGSFATINDAGYTTSIGTTATVATAT